LCILREMKHKYLERTFLNPAPSDLTSFILAQVESTRNGEYKFGNNLLTIGDCKRSIQLEFFLGTPKARRESLKKINLLIATLVRFGHTLMTESQAIEKFEKAPKKVAKKSTRKRKTNAR
jgi:hypothetical protein